MSLGCWIGAADATRANISSEFDCFDETDRRRLYGFAASRPIRRECGQVARHAVFCGRFKEGGPLDVQIMERDLHVRHLRCDRSRGSSTAESRKLRTPTADAWRVNLGRWTLRRLPLGSR